MATTAEKQLPWWLMLADVDYAVIKGHDAEGNPFTYEMGAHLKPTHPIIHDPTAEVPIPCPDHLR